MSISLEIARINILEFFLSIFPTRRHWQPRDYNDTISYSPGLYKKSLIPYIMCQLAMPISIYLSAKTCLYIGFSFYLI